jgi:hypothetical protein
VKTKVKSDFTAEKLANLEKLINSKDSLRQLMDAQERSIKELQGDFLKD